MLQWLFLSAPARLSSLFRRNKQTFDADRINILLLVYPERKNAKKWSFKALTQWLHHFQQMAIICSRLPLYVLIGVKTVCGVTASANVNFREVNGSSYNHYLQICQLSSCPLSSVYADFRLYVPISDRNYIGLVPIFITWDIHINVHANVYVYSLISPWVQQTLQFTPLLL